MSAPIPLSNEPLPGSQQFRPPPFLEEAIRQLIDDLEASSPSNRLTRSQVAEALEALPRLTESEVASLGHTDSMCPICFTPFTSLLAEEEVAIVMDSPAHPIESLGVSKLPCAHLFCRKDLTQWITDAHDSCPICRRLIIQTQTPQTEGEQPPISSPTQDMLERLLSTLAGGNIQDPFFFDISSELRSSRGPSSSVPEEYSGMYS